MANPQMDAAAEQAAKELDQLDQDVVRELANWWKAHYMTAGHKRLGRKLIERAASPTAELEELIKE